MEYLLHLIKGTKMPKKEDRVDWSLHLSYIEESARKGVTLKDIGKEIGVSGQTIRNVIKQHLPHLRGVPLGARAVTEQRVASQLQLTEEKQQERLKKKGRLLYHHQNDVSRRMARAFVEKRRNAKADGKWEWDIEQGDIDFPLICPILGLELNWLGGSRQENSPSFDRLDSTKGYVKGNVIICSWRANRIKNDGTSKEHELIASFLKGHNL